MAHDRDLAPLLARSVHQARAKRLQQEQRGKKMSESTAEVIEVQALAKREPQSAALARPAEVGISVDEIVARVEKVQEVARRVMKEGTHFGKVPGAGDKRCLFKPGAELLGLTFQLDPDFEATDRWDGDHLECTVKCTLFHAPTGARLGSGIGSCSTRESKYAWRNGKAKCPTCGHVDALTKSKDKPEFFCWRKKGGCGATFNAKDPAITSQVVGKIPNPDLADQYNTVRKMACKRAHVAAILFVTCASEIFTQDIEEERDPGINPHRGPGDEWDPPPPDDGALGREVAAKLEKVKGALARCDTYDKALQLRGIIGSRAKMSDLMKRHQAGKESGDITPRQASEIDKLWQHCDRQVAKLEKQLAPGPEDALVGDDDGTDAFGATEREPGSGDV